jgi:hypothetical protein
LLYLILGFLLARPLAATVDPGEIIPGSVYAQVSSTFDPVNGYSVTFYFQTVHPGSSIVVIENDVNYEENNNLSSRRIVQNDFTTNHVVVVSHFPAYHIYLNWGYYVASVVSETFPHCPTVLTAVCTFTATYPGPPTPYCSNPPAPGCGGSYAIFSLWNPPNPNNPLVFTMWPIGGQNVYQGDPTQSPACTPTSKSSRECNDLYVAMQPNQMDGPAGAAVQMLNPVITNLDTGQIVTDQSITAQYLCDLDAPSNPPPQGWDGDYSSSETCYNATTFTSNSSLRIRANSHATPGHYQFTGSFQGQLNGQNAGAPTAVTYNFTVLPTASFTATPPTNFPAIPGLATWQNNMINFNAPPGSSNADFWCTNITDTAAYSLDNGNFSGYFDFPSGYAYEAWNYDGGRVYQQVNDYDQYIIQQYKLMDPHEWMRCGELVLEPYADTEVATGASFAQEANQFPYGMEMNFLRTGNPLYQQGVDLLAHSEAYNLYYSGPVYAHSARLSGYLMDDRLADEMVGRPQVSPFTLRATDVLLGYLDQSYNLSLSNPNQQEYDIHPFMIGLAMEALITYYELDVAEGNSPDARIPLEIKKVLDWWKATQYIPQTYTLASDAYDLPDNPALVGGPLFDSTELNDLVATAWAWYWYKSGNNTYMNQGDLLFQHVWDSAQGQNNGGGLGWTYSVEQYNQVYKWSFDYVRWRSGQNPDGSSPPIETVLPAANPCGNQSGPCNAPWPDWTTPIQFEWTEGFINSQIAPTVVNSTTATFFLNVFKPNTTMQVWYGTTNPPQCNPQDPQSPYCMQPFPNFGFLTMLQDSYADQSQVVPCQGSGDNYNCTVTLTGLTPSTTYHWRTLTADSLGNMAAYHDSTFTTLSQ